MTRGKGDAGGMRDDDDVQSADLGKGWPGSTAFPVAAYPTCLCASVTVLVPVLLARAAAAE